MDGRPYDLEERMIRFAVDVRGFVKNIPKTVQNNEDGRQVIRSSGSVGANYIEARESHGKKDELLRLRIARKEAKETRYWLQLLDCPHELEDERGVLVQEANELMLIFNSIINKRM